ncbi:MAG TPA: DNA helicase RecQ [Burkholderiaceae bacterium]|nr:DNA helicase RecQ [Burkholderiaceae bacterium]
MVARTAQSVLKDTFGYDSFRGFQAEVIEHINSGGDALVLMPTGGGKSLTYQIPAMLREGVGIVVSPLIALMQDQVMALDEAGVRAAFLNSSLSSADAAAVERRMRGGQLDLVYIAPERLMSERCQRLLDDMQQRAGLALFAIDEAHCVSQWGHDFRPEYGQLAILRERFENVPRIALTATADVPTRQEIAERLLLDPRVFVASFDRPNIRYRIIEKRDAREQLLRFIRDEHPADAGIVYCLARNTVDEVAAFLCANEIRALPYHAGMDTGARAANQSQFLQEDRRVMVATIAFGMGIDKPDVRFVAHLDMPRSIEGYFQETGRAGRDGEPADAWMTYGLADVVQQRRLIEMSDAEATYKRLSSAKLDAMLGLAEAADCRRVRLLSYFGEASKPCGNCDNCLAPPQRIDATEAARKLLSCIYRCERGSGFGFAATHIIDVLRGKQTEKVAKFGHERLSTFGIGTEMSEAEWRLLLRHLVAQHVVEVDHSTFNVLRLTEASRAVLRGERTIELRQQSGEPHRRKSKQRVPDADSEHSPMFEKLRLWRAGVAKEHGLPAFVIFHDGTLRTIAQVRPNSLDQLRTISGVGEKKLASYGNDLLTLLSADA